MGHIFIKKLLEFEQEGKIVIAAEITDNNLLSIVSRSLNIVNNPKYQVNAIYLWRYFFSLKYYSNVFLIFLVHKISGDRSDISSVLAEIARYVFDLLLKFHVIEIEKGNQDSESIKNEVKLYFIFSFVFK